MPNSDLHTEGWRQGSVVTAPFFAAINRLSGGEVLTETYRYGRWVVCTQDCDLRSSVTSASEPVVELRAVSDDDPPNDWGIRSRRFRLTRDERVHDVLMQFNDQKNPPLYQLYAIVADDADKDDVRRWLSDVALRVKSDLGVLAGIDVGTRDEVPLSLVEESYAADLSQVTWSTEEPIGAE